MSLDFQKSESRSSSNVLRLLLIEDNDDDAFIVLRDLKLGGFDVRCTRADNEDVIRTHLTLDEFDLIICDYHLPNFNAIKAIRLVKSLDIDVPFICISGTVGEETAVEVMKAGAHDYIMKDRRTRFLPVIKRELAQAATRRRLRMQEEHSVQAQKMEAIGRLAGGVAHDFNNILASIIIYSELILEKMERENPSAGHIEQIKKAAERAAGLTGQLLAFSRKQVLETKIVDLNSVIVNLNLMLERVIGEHFNLVYELSKEPISIRIDPIQLDQVLMNLLLNARDAMSDGGKIVMSTRVREMKNEFVGMEEVIPGPYAIFEVKDEGHGMDLDTQKRIFEPFFTTKGPQKGTGLGLSTVFGIVKQSHGYVEVESEIKKGSIFRVYIPLVADAQLDQNTAKATKADSSLETQNKIILLLEDETNLRTLISEILSTRGFKVLLPKDGYDGSELIMNSANIDLMISDVVMPGISGPQMMEKLWKKHPKAQVLLMSGYLDETVNLDMSKGGFYFLQKPFNTQQLLKKIEEIIRTNLQAH